MLYEQILKVNKVTIKLIISWLRDNDANFPQRHLSIRCVKFDAKLVENINLLTLTEPLQLLITYNNTVML